MRPAEIEEIAERLAELGVPFVVVGGSALEREFSVGTSDVDLLVLVGDFQSLEELLADRKDMGPFEPTGNIGTAQVLVGSGWTEVEFITGSSFSGRQSGDSFVRYVRDYRSEKRAGVRWARPEVVWYMRLSTDDWQLYVIKIHRDLRAGVPASTFDGVLDVARHFGVEEKIRGRVGKAQEVVRLYR